MKRSPDPSCLSLTVQLTGNGKCVRIGANDRAQSGALPVEGFDSFEIELREVFACPTPRP